VKAIIVTLTLFTTIFPMIYGQSDIPAFMGDWEGRFDDQNGDTQLAARIIGLGDDLYRIQLLPEFDKRAGNYLEVDVKEQDGRLQFEEEGWTGTVVADQFKGRAMVKGKKRSYLLRKTERKSPTLAMEPPGGAVVLFDGSGLDKWEHPGMTGEKPVWKLEEDAAIITSGLKKVNGKRQKNDLVTKRLFKDIELHLEFKLPYCPEKRDQGRCNSGIFLQDFYEVQILDSYGLGGLWNECGALYKMAPPKVNMCAPPGQWQTYDIIYLMPRYNSSGERTKNAIVTVRHNGKIIHNQTEIVHPTAHSSKRRKTDIAPEGAAPIKIQDHGNSIQFRNIWVKELTENQDRE